MLLLSLLLAAPQAAAPVKAVPAPRLAAKAAPRTRRLELARIVRALPDARPVRRGAGGPQGL
jgi:hypothetical protein